MSHDELRERLIESAKQSYARDEITLDVLEERVEHALVATTTNRPTTGYAVVGIGNGEWATVPTFGPVTA